MLFRSTHLTPRPSTAHARLTLSPCQVAHANNPTTRKQHGGTQPPRCSKRRCPPPRNPPDGKGKSGNGDGNPAMQICYFWGAARRSAGDTSVANSQFPSAWDDDVPQQRCTRRRRDTMTKTSQTKRDDDDKESSLGETQMKLIAFPCLPQLLHVYWFMYLQSASLYRTGFTV